MTGRTFAPFRRPSTAAAPGRPVLQRKCAACGTGRGASERESRALHRSSQPGGEPPQFAPALVHEVLNSSGQPLDPSTRAFFEPRFGHDFSGVRVHADGRSAESAKAVGADAYTVGHDIVFARGMPGVTDNSLVAHELAHVVQQSGSSGTATSSLAISAPDDAAEREADAAANAAMTELAPQPIGPRPAGLFRQIAGGPGSGLGAVTTYGVTPTTSLIGSATSLSWIDPSSPAGTFLSDSPPPETVTPSFVLGKSGFRFSNYVHASVASNDGMHITDSSFLPDSGMSTGASFMGISSQPYSTQRKSTKGKENGVEHVDFDQTTGARTISAEVLGRKVGKATGGFAGWLLDLVSGSGDHTGIGSGKAVPATASWEKTGEAAGEEVGGIVANRITNFPPIWTRIRLRLRANGQHSCQLLRASFFPSVTLYCDLVQQEAHDALGLEQDVWGRFGWGGGNPWGATRPTDMP